MKKVFLHIGFHKTGSSALQECLAGNRDVLLSNGYFYPQSMQDKYPAHVDLSWALNSRPPEWAGFNVESTDEVLAYYKEQIESTACDNIVISSEDFVLLESQLQNVEKLKRFFLDCDLKVIAYVRNPTDFIVSLYSHAIRSRALTCDINEYVDRHFNFRSADYSVRLQPWVRVFGRDNMMVRPYSKESFLNNNLVDDFASAIGFQGELSEKERTSNVGVHPWLASAYLEICNSDSAEDVKIQSLESLLLLGSKLPKVNSAQYLMDPMLCRVIDKSYEVMKVRMQRDFGVIF